jgi:hypothetical protein
MGNGQKSRDNCEQVNDVINARVMRMADYVKPWSSRMNVPKMVRRIKKPTKIESGKRGIIL